MTPRERPSTEELLTRLQGMRVEVEGEHGCSHPIRLDMVRLRLSKEVKEKDRRMEDMRRNMEDITRQLEVRELPT